MSKPSDIPQDVWEAAEKATDDADEAFQDSIDDAHQRLEDAMPKAIEVVARAILNERNNAAKIAENLFTHETVNKNSRGKPYYAGEIAMSCSRRISEAIRKGGSE